MWSPFCLEPIPTNFTSIGLAGLGEDTNNKELTDDDGHKLTTTSQMTCFVKKANTSLTTMVDNII